MFAKAVHSAFWRFARWFSNLNSSKSHPTTCWSTYSERVYWRPTESRISGSSGQDSKSEHRISLKLNCWAGSSVFKIQTKANVRMEKRRNKSHKFTLIRCLKSWKICYKILQKLRLKKVRRETVSQRWASVLWRTTCGRKRQNLTGTWVRASCEISQKRKKLKSRWKKKFKKKDDLSRCDPTVRQWCLLRGQVVCKMLCKTKSLKMLNL